MIYLATAKRGGGKTSFCLNQLKAALDNKQKAAFVVPEQLSLHTEGRVIAAIGAVGGNVEVFSFNRLFRKVYSTTHRGKRKYLDKVGKNMLVNRILESDPDDFSVFCANTNVSEGLVSALSEFKRHFASAEQLAQAAEQFDTPISRQKFKELAVILERFNQSLCQTNADSDDNLTVLPALLEETDYTKDFTFYVDGFDGFTPQETSVLLGLAKQNDVYITLTLEENRKFLFRPTLETAEKLEQMAHAQGIACKRMPLPQWELKLPADLLHLQQQYGNFGNAPYAEVPQNIAAFSAENPYGECDAVSRRILHFVRNGYRFRDIVVLCPDLNSYRPILEKAFHAHGIPLFADQNKSLLLHSLTRLLLALCDVFIRNFDEKSVFSFLKNDLIPIPQADIDALEYYVLEAGISGADWQTEWQNSPNPAYNLEKLNKTRVTFLNLVMPFREKTKGKTPCVVFADALIEFLKAINADETINRKLQALTPAQVTEEVGVFNQVLGVIEQLKITLGDTAFGIEKLKNNLRAGFLGCSVGIVPPTFDHVTVSTSDRNNFGDCKILFILGANEGAFPASVGGSGLICDSERETLEELGITLSATNRKKALCSPFAVYMTLTAPSDKLILSYPIADSKGEAKTASSVFYDLKKLFPAFKIQSEFAPLPKEWITTPAAALPYILLSDNSQEHAQQAYGWYLENEQWKHKINRFFDAKQFALSWKLSEQCALSLWGKTLKVSISKLEKFASCPLSFFLTYGLKLKERKIHSFSPPEAGTLMHAVMETFVQDCIENNTDFKALTFEDTKQKTLEICKNVTNGQIALFPSVKARYAFLLSRIQNATVNAMWAVVHHIQAGVFTPYATEFDFDGKSSPVLETPNGNTLILTGKIDRIDKSETGYRIIDYKSGEKDLDLEAVQSGRSLQLPIYSYALKNKLGNPKGMFYLTVDMPLIERASDFSDSEPDDKLLKEYKLKGYTVGKPETLLEMDTKMHSHSSVITAQNTKNGLKSTRLLSAEDYQMIEDATIANVTQFGDRIMEGNYPILPYAEERFSACTYCAFRSVCRFDAKYCSYNMKQKGGDGNANRELDN